MFRCFKTITAIGLSGLLALIAGTPATAASSVVVLDANFQSSVGTGFDSVANALAVQSDGSIIVVGGFTTLNGTQAGKITRLLADGTQDTFFASSIGSGPNGQMADVAIQPDGKIVTAGQQQFWSAETLRYFSRINTDGTRDTAFNANVVASALAINVGQTIALQSDGKILLGGGAGSSGNAHGFARLNTDGTVDAAFRTALGSGIQGGPSPTVYATDVLPNGDVVVAGRFQQFNGVAAGNIVKLNSAGARDASFDSNLGSGFNGLISDVLPLSDGSFVVGGSFTSVNGIASAHLARILPSGVVDASFAAALGTSFDNAVNNVSLTASGKLLVSGAFATVDGGSSPRLAKIDMNGSPDSAFNALLGTGFNNEIAQSAEQPDGAIVSVGNFTTYNATSTGAIARLLPLNVTAINPGSQTTVMNTAVQLPIQAQADPNIGMLSFSATGLPTGLTIDPTTGIISGTPTTSGTYVITVAATHSSGASVEIPFNWTVTQPSIITIDSNDQTNTVGDNINLPTVATDSSGAALKFTATGLPKGLTIASNTGTITGTTTTAGTYSVAVTATNASGESASTTFTWVVKAVNVPPTTGPATPPGNAKKLATTGTNPGWNTGATLSVILAFVVGGSLIARGRIAASR